MTDQLISILMPVKNTGTFLSDCLHSILNQTEKHWELIAVNDHSTDDSLVILKAFAKKDNRIKIFNNKGTGIIEALRLAYANSQGILITRMDADDLMLPRKLATLKSALLKKDKGSLATGQVQYFSETTLGEGYQKYQDWLNGLTVNGTNFQEVYKECVIPSPCWMIYRADFEKCDAFRPNRYPEDYDLCFRFYEQQLQVIPCPIVLHQWRDYANRTSRTDDNYKDNRFLALKLHYFLKLDYDKNRPLIIWGAGKKGKWLAKQLVDQSIPFHWICNNEKKIGKNIYNQILLSIDALSTFQYPQLIISVAGDTFQQQITTTLIKSGMEKGKDYFFFC